MIEDNFLSALAKVMREQIKESNRMNTLYHIIDEELYSCLEEVQFPSVPELSRRLDQMLQYINALSLYPELCGNEVIAVYGHYTNQLLDDVKAEIKTGDFSWIRKHNMQIPILIMNAKRTEMEAVSTSFSKISINKEEMDLLLSQSMSKHIALNRLIKFIVIRVPMKSKDKCFLLDNRSKQLSELYDELITTKIGKITPQDMEDLKPGEFDSLDYLLCNEQCAKKITKKKLLGNSNTIIISTIEHSGLYKNKKVVISFFDLFKYAICPLEDYYNRNIKSLTDILGELTNDLIRDNNDVLVKFHDDLKEKLGKYQEAKETVDSILLRLEHEIKSIDASYRGIVSKTDGILTNCLRNCLFTYYFSVAGIDSQEEKKCIKRIFDCGYEYQELLLSYSKSLSGKKTECPAFDVSQVYSWECAKMLLHFSESAELDNDIIHLVNCLSKGDFTTGKEWYYWSLIHNDNNALTTAVQMGCDMAGRKLYEECGDDTGIKNLLSSVLYPDACVERGIQEAYEGEGVTDIHDKRLAYLKIAAAIGDSRGIELIADILYQNVIWDYFSHKGKPIKNAPKNRSYVEVFVTVLSLCESLITQKKEVSKNKERVAVINFCLNRNLSEVHAALYNKGSAAAYFCKGYLAEYGLYNTKDLDKALKCYEKVSGSEIPAVSNAKKRVKSKIQTREKNKQEEYDEEEDYSGYSSSSTVGSGGWCFITTAAGCALNKGRDCEELNFLRRFRDEHIKTSVEGQALVAEYYNIAPKIIEKIDLEEEASMIYAKLWTDYIVPSVKEIQAGNWQKAQDIYVVMVVDLSRKYGIHINKNGYEKLYHDTLKRIGYEQ